MTMPGSDIEEDEHNADDSEVVSYVGSIHRTADGSFRPPLDCPILVFSITSDLRGERSLFPTGRGDFLYESVFVLWLRSWIDQVQREENEKSWVSRKHPSSLLPIFRHDRPEVNSLRMFYEHMDVLLPLCLKSIVLRYAGAVQTSNFASSRVIMDDCHLNVLDSFVEMLALGLMGQGMDGLASNAQDASLQDALSASDHVLDFLTGLCTTFHPAHMSSLLQKFLTTLRNCETEFIDAKDGGSEFDWTAENLHRVKCSRQLRLRAVEKLAVLPNFVALNFPLKYSSRQHVKRQKKTTWTMQYTDPNEEMSSKHARIAGVDDLLPQSGWLAHLLTTESLSICSLSCEAVVAEAMAQIETQENKPPSSKPSSMKKRPSAFLKRADLLMFQSMAIHAITCVHELLLRRHAMDKRYQKESSRERIAALFARPIFEKSLASVRWLARMESTHRVRSLWLLCFVYVLQEAPEDLVRELAGSYSKSKVRVISASVSLPLFGCLLTLPLPFPGYSNSSFHSPSSPWKFHVPKFH